MNSSSSPGSQASNLFETLLTTVNQISSLHDDGAFRSLDEETKARKYAQLMQKRDEIERMLKALGSQGVQPPSRSCNHGVAKTEQIEDEEQIYENTAALAKLASQSQSKQPADPPPPPLPPRQPRTRPPTTTSSSSSSIRPSHSRTSIKPKEETVQEKLKRLQDERDELTRYLEVDSKERTRCTLELDNITRKVQTLSSPSTKFSLENEAERQRLEAEAEEIKLQLQHRLGLTRRQEHLDELRRVESEIADLQRPGNPNHPPRTSRPPQPPPRLSSNPDSYYQDNLDNRRDRGPYPEHYQPQSHQHISYQHRQQIFQQEDTASVVSWSSSIPTHCQQTLKHSNPDTMAVSSRRREEIDSKIECIDSMISLMDCDDMDKLAKKFEALSTHPANCDVMRTNRIVEGLVQMLHSNHRKEEFQDRTSRDVRLRVSKALNNIVHAHPMDKQCKREAKVLKLLEILRIYSDVLRDLMLASRTASNFSADLNRITDHGCRPIRVQLTEGSSNHFRLLILKDIESNGSKNNSSRSISPESRLEVSSEEVVASATIPSRNFINFSHEGIVMADGSVVLQLNVLETLVILTKCSYDESHRQPISFLGGIRALAELLQVEYELHNRTCDGPCSEVRRYAIVALTNLTFGNSSVKSFLTSFDGFIQTIVRQIESPKDYLIKATAQLFRNLAWKADKQSKQILSDSNVVQVLMYAAMEAGLRMNEQSLSSSNDSKEHSTIKVILSALWNLSAHCGRNKAQICSMDGALEFLVSLLYQKSESIVENAGGILRNVSSYIATCEEGYHYRQILRGQNFLSILLEQLESPSLNIVSNACGTLWNFSARCPEDQETLWALGAVPKLVALTESKHQQISTCSKATLKNLTSSNSNSSNTRAAQFSSPSMSRKENGPSLEVRRRKNMVLELDSKLRETSDRHHGSSDESNEANSDEEQDFDRYTSHSHHPYSKESTLSGGTRASEGEYFQDDSGGATFRHPLELNKNRHQVFVKPLDYQPQQEFTGKPRQLVNNYVNPLESEHGSSGNNSPYSTTREERIMSASRLVHSNPDEEEDEKPTDYSAKFGDNEDVVEANSGTDSANASATADQIKQEEEEEIKEEMNDESDEEQDENCAAALNNDEDEEDENNDRVKTYCTEATPYDTPYLSKAASLLNLGDNDDVSPQNVAQSRPEPGPLFVRRSRPLRGTETPASDRPKNYCSEGTPGVISHAESLSSLESGDDDEINGSRPQYEEEIEESEEKGQIEAKESKEASPLPERRKAAVIPQSHGTVTPKAVTFNPHETPLMFSRASSPDSLSSDVQHPIRTNYNSHAVSMTTTRDPSPAPSQSELPDSPCQTRPQTPPALRKINHASKESGAKNFHSQTVNVSSKASNYSIKDEDGSVMDEKVRVFKDEGTPGDVLSSKTSISKLTFSDDEGRAEAKAFSATASSTGRTEEEEDIYEECMLRDLMQSGMPTKKVEAPRVASRASAKKSKSSSGIPIKSSASSLPKQTAFHHQFRPHQFGFSSHQSASSIPGSSRAESIRNFKTEETPGTRSRAESNSNLSALTFNDDEEGDSDDSELLREITRIGLQSKQKATLVVAPNVRVEGEGAPARHSVPAAVVKPMTKQPVAEVSKKPDVSQKPNILKVPPNPSKRQGSSVSPVGEVHPQRKDIKQQDKSKGGGAFQSGVASGCETPRKFTSEDTPGVFSRQDSISSLSNCEENEFEAVARPLEATPQFRSHIPRPEALGKSESSESSTQSSGNKKSAAGKTKSNANTDDEDEEEFRLCISSGMPKSKSMPLNLKNSAKKNKKASPTKEKKRRSTSKSPRNSRVIPGVRISELKLKPKEKSPSVADEKISSMAVNETLTGDIPNFAEAKQSDQMSSMETTLTASTVNQLRKPEQDDQENSNSLSSSKVISREAKRLSDEIKRTADGLVGSTSSDIGTIQPPSVMNSLISISGGPASLIMSSPSNTSPSKTVLECRHTVKGKKLGAAGVPEMVRRALGPNLMVASNQSSGSNDDLSSLSSCHSNLDNINPPTLMEEMGNSIMSVTSLHSEFAENSHHNDFSSLNSEQMAHLVQPSAEQAAKLALAKASRTNGEDYSEVSKSGMINDVNPPTLMEEVSGVTCSQTLKPQVDDGTYVVEKDENVAQSTCHDVTDVFEDDTLVEPSLTMDSDALDADEAPDLPRDSRHSTPAHSRHASPRKKVNNEDIEHFKKFRVEVPDLDDSDQVSHETSGYKSENASQSSNKPSWVRRKDEGDRFKTHVITKDDLSKTDTGSETDSFTGCHKNSPKSLKQRREEEAERFRTQTITASDLKPKSLHHVPLSPMEAKVIQEDARIVAETLADTHLNDAQTNIPLDRSRSVSLDLLEENEMNLQMEIGGSAPESPRRGARICKPHEGKEQDTSRKPEDSPVKAVRGRRKPLYSSPTARTTVPPAVAPKPKIAPKPRSSLPSTTTTRTSSPPTQIRGTRTTNLRQSSNLTRNGSPPGSTSKVSPRGGGYSSASSTISSVSSSRLSSSSLSSSKLPGRIKQPSSKTSLVRQGTFTKEDSSSNQSAGEESQNLSRMPPRAPSKSSIRRDVVHPEPRSPKSPKIAQTRTSKLRERSSSRSGRTLDSSQRHFSSGSNSSLASSRSGRVAQGVKTSISNHNLKQEKPPTGLEKRSPSSPGFVTGRNNVSIQSSENGTPKGKQSSGKKEVTSRIASLWKKVEDSKNSKKPKDAKDPRIWITQGKTIPESDLALLKEHQEQREIINSFQEAKKNAELSTSSDLKPRSKSRLSLKLSKFKGSRRDSSGGKTPTSPNGFEDSLNGSSKDANESMDQLSELSNDKSVKRHSRLGTFVNPNEDNEVSPVENRQPTSAIVQPFNYNPPAGEQQAVPTTSTPVSVSTSQIPGTFRKPAAPPTKSLSAVQVRRNDSYVSSMGRKSRDDEISSPEIPKKTGEKDSSKKAEATSSSSMLVTLV